MVVLGDVTEAEGSGYVGEGVDEDEPAACLAVVREVVV